MLRPSLSDPRQCRIRRGHQVSPEFMLRPSLSARLPTTRPRPAAGVAGVYAPAFVERALASARRSRRADERVAGVYAPAFVERRVKHGSRRCASSVAGVYAPAFVERAIADRASSARPVSPEFMLRPSLSGPEVPRRLRWTDGVSPEFMLRPSLSASLERAVPRAVRGVAGVYAPAFVERVHGRSEARRAGDRVSPEFMLRPSLSEWIAIRAMQNALASVAGVYAPAFVERHRRTCGLVASSRVAGVYAPAFVERSCDRPGCCASEVSPEFMLRPSLSAAGAAWARPGVGCRRSLCSGLR